MNQLDEAKNKLMTYGSKMFLGRLVWYNVSESLVISHSQFHQAVLKNFINDDVEAQPKLPGLPRPTDVFKRACTAATVKNVQSDLEDILYNYSVRPAGHDKDHVWRVLVRENVDVEGHSLGYETLVKFQFNRNTEAIDVSFAVDAKYDLMAQQIIVQVINYYASEIDRITPYAVREFTRKYLERTLKATKVRPSGGVYFVSESVAASIEALDSTLNSLGYGASFHYLPVVDDSKQREMLKRAFEEESVDQIDKLIGEMTEIIKSKKKISSDHFANFKVEYDSLKQKLLSYREILDDSLDNTDNRLGIMETVLMNLISNVKG